MFNWLFGDYASDDLDNQADMESGVDECEIDMDEIDWDEHDVPF